MKPHEPEDFDHKYRKGPRCWEWKVPFTSDGYALWHEYGWKSNASRVIWERKHGPIPIGLQVCHHCDNPKCIKASHLFLGTIGDNMADKKAKGRAPSGDQHWQRLKPHLRKPAGTYPGKPKVPVAERTVLAARYYAGEPTVQLAREYGISTTSIRKIAKRYDDGLAQHHGHHPS